MNRLFIVIFMVVISLTGGCASYMPLADGTSKLETAKPLYLMSVVMKNDYKERWQPRLLNVVLSKENGAGKPERLVFRMDDKGIIESSRDGGPKTFLVRFATDGTPHTVAGFSAMASAFPINGGYFAPLHSPVSAAGSGVYYLGSVSAVIRERKDNEFRAGSVIPLIDQAVAGASSGTFDVAISDAFATDVELFKKTFPALKDVSITKAVLPPWDRAKVQLAWEND